MFSSRCYAQLVSLFRASSWTKKRSLTSAALFCSTWLVLGCASPGPPKAPSLNLPEPVNDLQADRVGDAVKLTFTVPSKSTDKLPLRGLTVTAQLCREIGHGACIAISGSKREFAVPPAGGTRQMGTLSDVLSDDLTHSRPGILGYRITFSNAADHNAGPSVPAFTATGPAPEAVTGFHVSGSRVGALLLWDPSETTRSAVQIQRETLNPVQSQKAVSQNKSDSKPIILECPAGEASTNAHELLDATALPATAYRYIATRRSTLQFGGHTITLHSNPSARVDFTLHEIYPPPTPVGLTAVRFSQDSTHASSVSGAAFAIDLIWQPVDDKGLIAGLAGYNIYRRALDTAGATKERLNSAPVAVPSFHDASALRTKGYLYSVTAVDLKGNESPAINATVEPPTSR
jgi:hypothetical protein